MNLLKYLKNKSRGDPGKSLQFGVYNNIGHNKDDIVRDMSSWAFKLESQGRISQTWCIKDMMIDVVGDVDVRGIELIFPFGVVTGEFICDAAQKKSPNYPKHIAHIRSDNLIN